MEYSDGKTQYTLWGVGLCCKRRQLRAAPAAVAVGHGKMVVTFNKAGGGQ